MKKFHCDNLSWKVRDVFLIYTHIHIHICICIYNIDVFIYVYACIIVCFGLYMYMCVHMYYMDSLSICIYVNVRVTVYLSRFNNLVYFFFLPFLSYLIQWLFSWSYMHISLIWWIARTLTRKKLYLALSLQPGCSSGLGFSIGWHMNHPYDWVQDNHCGTIRTPDGVLDELCD